MSLSIRDVALVTPLSLSILAAIPVAAASSGSEESQAGLMSLPVYGMLTGALIVAAYWALDYGIKRAAEKRLPGEVLHP